MLNINDNDKQRIGKLFKYYRKKNKIQWKEIDKICSTSTYTKLEKGYVSKKDDIYENIFKLFRISYKDKSNFIEWLNQYLIRFNESIEFYKEEQFSLLFDELEKELGVYKHTVIYEQYYQILSHILNYYKNTRYMTLEEIHSCLNLLECFDFEDVIKIYLLEVMFISNTNVHYSYELQDKLFEYIQIIKHPIMYYHLGFYYKTKSLFDAALNYFNQSISYWLENENDYQYVRSLMGKFVVYKNIDQNKADELIEIFADLRNEGRVKQTIVPSLNYNIGMYYYVDQNFDKALPYFYENINQFNRTQDLIFLCFICTKLNIQLPEVIKTMNLANHPHSTYLIYFRLKALGENRNKLVNYIFQEIIPNELIHQIYTQPLWEFFEEELLRYSNEDKRYAVKLVEYIEKKKKTCKSI